MAHWQRPAVACADHFPANYVHVKFQSATGPPLILRVYGTARILHPRAPRWDAAIADFPPMAGLRQVFDLRIDAVQTSCGTGVPHMTFAGERASKELLPYDEDLGPDGVRDFWQRKNTRTIDGFDTGLFDDPAD